MNLITEARLALIAQLETITTANGYHTNAGANVRGGWFNEALQAADVAFPLIVVQRAKGDAPTPGPGAIKVYPGFSVVGAVDAGLDGYDSALEDIELDLQRCLMPQIGARLTWAPKGVCDITVGAAEQYPPGNGEVAASVLLPINLHAVIR